MARLSAAALVGGAACILANLTTAAARAEAPGEQVTFQDLPDFAKDDFVKALGAFRASCAASVGKAKVLRSAVEPPTSLAQVCAVAPTKANAARARAFFEHHFVPRRISSSAFFTGYYEPLVEGSLVATKAFATPLYAPPTHLVTVKAGSTPSLDPALTAAQRLNDGRLVALPDRAGIESGQLNSARPLLYVREPVEAFFIQIQGSARIRLPNGQLRRLVFAGRNGYPYTSIGKILVARLKIPPSEMGLTELKAWIRTHGQGPNDDGTALMRENRSFIFFAFDDKLSPKAGPIGGEGVSLTAQRSLAIDRTIWPYGLPFYVSTELPDGRAFRRLAVAQDTGAGIRGSARADIFFGSGSKAAQEAGPVRQTGTLYVLWPKPIETPRSGPRRKRSAR